VNVAAASPRVAARLKITEIFLSLQGESSRVGLPTVFVRLTGCPLRCQYCDTAYAFHGGRWMEQDEVISQVVAYGVRQVCVTGGEPLAQKACLPLLRRLSDDGYAVSLETSGALDISAVDSRVMRIVDVKTPGSGEVQRNIWNNLDQLTSNDEVKFVLCSREDYDWAASIIQQYRIGERCGILLSPSHEQLAPRDLADWIVQDRLPVRMQLQMHKILWGGAPGR
jgi:7-carboxy-7-deazaguanine synthase